MSLLLGALLGVGAALILDWLLYEPWVRRRKPRARIQGALLQAGIATVRPSRFVLVCLCTGFCAGLLILALTGSFLFGALFGGFGLLAPWVYLRYQAAKRRAALREQWPEVVDHLR
ncbi:type II secretion system F family protein, partial [Glutamicibacter creatinolyticus]|uniref:type II secretion system F family protein n=2 Tax=Micrococcaceae TaxID=1268 RepID=UPI003B985A3B